MWIDMLLYQCRNELTNRTQYVIQRSRFIFNGDRVDTSVLQTMQPCFMFVMALGEILYWNFFSCTPPFFTPLEGNRWIASDINNGRDGYILLKDMKPLFVNGKFFL